MAQKWHGDASPAAPKLRKALTAGDAPREAVTAWLSWSLQRNALRASVITPEARKAGNQEYMAKYKQLAAATAGDEFVCNLAAAVLRLCEPFLKFGEAPPAATLLKLRKRVAARVRAAGTCLERNLRGQLVQPSLPKLSRR